ISRSIVASSAIRSSSETITHPYSASSAAAQRALSPSSALWTRRTFGWAYMKGPVGIVAPRVGIVAPYNDLRDSSIRRIVVEDGPDVRRALPVEDNDRGDGFG